MYIQHYTLFHCGTKTITVGGKKNADYFACQRWTCICILGGSVDKCMFKVEYVLTESKIAYFSKAQVDKFLNSHKITPFHF